MIGGIIMGLAILLYFVVLVKSLVGARDPQSDETILGVGYSTRWATAAVLLIVMAYYMPLRDTCEITITGSGRL